MPPALPLPGPPAGESFLSRSSLLTDRNRNGSTPMSWLHVIGFVLVLWAAASDAMAQAREILVTEVSGSAVRSVGSGPVKALETLRPGDRVRLGTESRIGAFSSQDAQLYIVDGPAEISITRDGITANGRPVAGRKLDDVYRNIKARPADLVQGSLVMRSARSLRLAAPEGPVALADARTYTWTGEPVPWLFELGTDEGEPVYSATVSGNRLELPPAIVLKPGVKYVWGLRASGPGAPPVDWTEFVVRDGGPAQRAGASPSERTVHALWLQSQSLTRAATRSMEEGVPRD